MEEFDKKISEIVRKTVKEFMESLMKGEIQAYLEENNGSRNGYYERDLGTRYGKINDLRIQGIEIMNSRQLYLRNIREMLVLMILLYPCIQREYQQGRWQKYLRKYSIINTANPQYQGSPT